MTITRTANHPLSVGLILSVGVSSASFVSSPAMAQEDPPKPEVIHLPTVVRDFRKDHVDFDVTPSDGNGHYAGNVKLGLDETDRPEFRSSGTGFKVASQWRDKASHPIAPHLFRDPMTMQLASELTKDDEAVIDSWDSSQGPYSPSNSGPEPNVMYGAPMPAVVPPEMTVPFQSIVVWQNQSPNPYYTLTTDIYCGSLSSKQQTTINVQGHRTIHCTGDFILAKQNIVKIMPDSSLKVYVDGKFQISQMSQYNMNTYNPQLAYIYKLGSGEVNVNQSSSLCATVIAPEGILHLNQTDHFYGTFIGQTIKLDQDTGFHWDSRPLLDFCGVELEDKAGSPGASSTGGVTSADTFNEWFRDFMGVNLSNRYMIELRKTDEGIFEFLDDAFFPIDGQLFGNENMPHNFFFTLALTADFTHHACDGRFFEFQGADDAWLFINKNLAIDLGGIIPGTEQYIDMDRLDLEDGTTYSLHFFYAQRNPTTAQFRMRTNLDLQVSDDETTVSAGFD